MGRGGIRRSRTHQMGKSNRPRISKLADEVTVLHSAPDLKYTDTKSQVGPWKRATKLLTGPQIERTRCGGTIVRPASRVSASRYSDVVEEHVNDHSSMNFMQDNEWSNTQPLMGIPDWNPGEAPRAPACFSVTDDVFD